MDAVQAMRRQAQDAGTLQSTPEESVGTQDNLVTIEPAGGDEVYLPAYDPWVVYGEPVPPWPDWYPCPGIWFDGPSLSFGIGCPIGFFATYPGAGTAGGSTGATTGSCITTNATSPGAARSTTGPAPTSGRAPRPERAWPAAFRGTTTARRGG